ncbi:MAG TPA: DHH family phosphoesterase [Candidatus Aenigmarchaeota archaeon]|nr:DHH family phosphoesterase [Candidatus Aenigmarchaeota archaeon]
MVRKVIEGSKRPCIITHSDTDGICSAAIVLKEFEDKKFKVLVASPNSMAQRRFYRLLPKADLYLFLDLPLDQVWDVAKNFLKGKVIVMDHHKPQRNLNEEGVIHINPLFERDKYYPASKLVHDLLGSSHHWVAAIGIVGDMGVKEWKDFLKGFDMKALEEADKLIGSAMIYKGERGALKAIELVSKADSIEDLLENKTLRSWREKVDKYLNVLVEEFGSKAERIDEVAFYEIRPKYRIGSALATVLSQRYPHLTIVVINKKDGVANINFRRQDGKYDMEELARYSTQGIGKGGGHKKAAGGSIKLSGLEEFKRRVVQYLRGKK